MKKSFGVRSGALAGFLVASGILAKLYIGASLFDNHTQTTLRRLQPAPVAGALCVKPNDNKPEHEPVGSEPEAPPEDPGSSHLHLTQVIEQLASRERQEKFAAIFAVNEWGGKESVSGDGSTEKYSRNARSLLAHTFTEYGIKDWIDSPCGDCNWQPRVEGFADVSYLGLDIVPALIESNKAKFVNQTNMRFKQQDLINEPFPHRPDLILCRDMIQHNSLVDGVTAYYNIEKSGAKYLATTWHQQGAGNIMGHNTNEPAGGMYHVNIFLHPFNFSQPEFFIREGHAPPGFEEDDKFIGLWRLPALGLGGGQMFDMPEEYYNQADTSLVQVKDMVRTPQ